jgi:Ca2+:H+ antiporter
VRRLYYLGVFVPLALALHLAHASAPLVLFTSAVGVVPAAALMSEATEQLAERSGPGIAGLLNVTFGNAPELIIAVFALSDGLHELVKASLVGSVIGNSLLVLGAAMLAGGWRRTRQTFSRTTAQTQSGMLLLTVVAMVLPAVFQLVHGGRLPPVGEPRRSFGHDLEHLSLGIAVILIATYLAGLFFSLRTHRDLFNPDYGEDGRARWSMRRSILTLGTAAVLVAVASDTLVGSIAHASSDLGLSQFFIGVFIVAIVGNAAEHYVAVVAAFKDRMDLSVNIAIGSSAQIGLFVVPVIVLLSFVVGPGPMALVFNGYELAALIIAALLTATLASEGESTWFEGVQLLAAYAVLGLVFVFA